MRWVYNFGLRDMPKILASKSKLGSDIMMSVAPIYDSGKANSYIIYFLSWSFD